MAALTAQQLLKLDDGDFQSKIQDMSVKNLIDTISVIQKEMSREQENFNALSAEQGSLKRNSGQYKSISKDMTASQTRLTLLMDRSMKCFSQQGNQQSKAAVERRNSFQGSQSKGNVQNRASEPVKATAVTQATTDRKSMTSVEESKKRFDNGTSNRPSYQVQSLKSNSPVLRNKSNDINGSGNINGDFRKSLSMSLSKNDDNENKPQLGNKGSETSKVNGQQNNASVSNTVVSLGPMAEQRNKFMSKSSDNVFKKPSETAPQKPDVVKGKVSSKPASKVVLNADKQMMDLDTFTERRNMLDELKKFDKTLKPSAPRTQVTEVKVNVAKSGEKRSSANMEPKGPVTPVEQKGNLLGDIKLGKKPSELKQTKAPKSEQNVNNHVVNNKPVNKTSLDSQAKQFEDLLKDSESDKSESSEESPRETIIPSVQKQMTNIPASGEVTLDEVRGTTPLVEAGDDSTSQSSGVSEEDDTFVTEFHFSGSQIKAPSAEAAIPKKQG